MFLVAANKVGPLIPEHLLEAVSTETHIPLQFLYGAGESQIVSPDGEVLARGPREGEAVVWADIELEKADDKQRADGTDSFVIRRPCLYKAIAEPPAPVDNPKPASQVLVSCLQPDVHGLEALSEFSGMVAALPSQTSLAVLPELAFGDDSSTALQIIEAMAAVCSGHPGLLLCTSLMEQGESGVTHSAVLVGEGGTVARQAQLHDSSRFPGLTTPNAMTLVDLPWARVALLTSEDAWSPELIKVAAVQGAHVLVVPGQLLAPWEHSLALPSRAAENRICVVYSSRPVAGKAGLIANLDTDFTLMTPWQERKFDGYIN